MHRQKEYIFFYSFFGVFRQIVCFTHPLADLKGMFFYPFWYFLMQIVCFAPTLEISLRMPMDEWTHIFVITRLLNILYIYFMYCVT